jgi:hypothetical protein
VYVQQDGPFPLVCVHCGEPERPGDPVQECAVGDGELYLLHRHCQAEWLGDSWDIPDWLRRAPT